MDYRDYYGESNKHNADGSGWAALFGRVLSMDSGFFHIMQTVAVFAAGIAFLAAVTLLAISAGGGTSSKTFQEAKKWVLRVIVISILIFGVTGLITMVGAMGMD